MTHSRNTANPTVVNRRQALAGAGAGAAAGALALTCPAMADVPKPDRLAKLIHRYYAEYEEWSFAEFLNDDEMDANALETYHKTMIDIAGVPATTAVGAFAALHFIRRETKNRYYGRDLDNAIEFLFNAVRDHIDPALNSARETQEDLLF